MGLAYGELSTSNKFVISNKSCMINKSTIDFEVLTNLFKKRLIEFLQQIVKKADNDVMTNFQPG